MPRHRRKNHAAGLRAFAPNRFWHADVTVYRPLDNAKVYIYLVTDNFSRFVLGQKVSLTLSARLCVENVREALAAYGPPSALSPVHIVVDGGPENKSIPLSFDPAALKSLVAQRDIVFSNSLAEAMNKTLKYRYLFPRNLRDAEDVEKCLGSAIHDFNFLRPNGQLGGLTPAEAFFGVEAPAEKFKTQIQESLKARRSENRANACSDCPAD